ncbi:MAG: septum formation protein Maf [Bacteroidales bacterium]|nr:septum formation protein Maf [Bacteroidales bacterium]
MDLKGKKLILASNSPRRRELLAGLDVNFTVDAHTRFMEKFSPDTPHEIVPVLMSEGKSEGFHRPLEKDEILITADTMVLCGDQILGKPKSHADEVRMLKLLSGREHHVITAVTLRDRERHVTETDTSTVWFKDLDDEEIDYYLRRYHPHDKAGSYGIQEWIGYIGISRIEGSYFNIMGLPVHLLYGMLKDFIG